MHTELKSVVDCPSEWATLEASTPDYAVSTRWLETMGPLLPGEPRWFVASVDGQPQVGLYTRWLDDPPTEPRYDIAAILRGDIPAFGERLAAAPAAAAESLYPAVLALQPGYTCAAAGPGATDPAMLHNTLQTLSGWAEQQGAKSVSFLYVPERQRLLHKVLADFGAQPVSLYPTCVMSVDFGDVEEFLAQLPRQRRGDLRRLLRRIDESGMTLGEDDLGAVRDQVLELRSSTLHKYDSVAERDVQAATLDRMIRHYSPEDRVVTTIRRAEQVVGFVLALRHGDTLRALWCGQQPDAYGAYFVMAYYGLVAAALKRGVTHIDYGTLKWPLKMSFGCVLEELAGYTWTP
ncbi:GNAT family N-acetyltransferase [Nocardia sp. NBC_00403]|uniref:GNAT family N-acetyltransferase n=1 Tax=Nocardia sp. NBC_00403 TaxID=2975990 RepID=UPI002E1BC730